MKVRMYPHPEELSGNASGIAQVVLNYARHLPQFGVELVGTNATTYDLDAGHAAAYPGAMVNHNHGLLWTAEREYSNAGYQTNADLVRAIKLARETTVPSAWVAETFERDMHFRPHIVPHGVNWDEWQGDYKNEGYVLWGKNRTTDGLDPSAIVDIAKAFPNIEFVTTFGAPGMPDNVKVLGHAIPHEQMQTIVKSAAVILATDKETWGLLPAEAMAAGIPVLTINQGAVPTFVPHGVAGYAFQPHNLNDAINGLGYCLQYRDQLGANGRELARDLTWENACAAVADIYQSALTTEAPTVSIVIPCYNYGHMLDKAIASAVNQNYNFIQEVIVVDDGSTDGTHDVAMQWALRHGHVKIIQQENSGVAEARNVGWQHADSKYVVFLDADDEIEPEFVATLVPALEENPNAGFAYTGVRVPLPDGTEFMPWDWKYQTERHQVISHRIWPQSFNFDAQMERANQVPTCCLVRRKALLRAGGYRSRYCPLGAGSEDAEMFLRLGSHGWSGIYIPSRANALFVHRHGEGTVSGREGYEEPDWTSWHSWTKDGKHPFASVANPANGFSHPIHSYDSPMVSVVIPVGPGHEKAVVNALDSLEAQTFRGWEAIVVWDSPEKPSKYLMDAYPFVKLRLMVPGRNGPGKARNLGASMARGPLLAFLDADDYYHAEFLRECVNHFMTYDAAIYTNFVSIVPKESWPQPGMEFIREKEDGTVLARGHFGQFDQKKALKRPSGDRPYVWSGVTILVPKVWHDKMGGFDEGMTTWEDCDYLLRLAWYGNNFYRIPEELWIYSFVSGTRRENANGREHELIQYMQEKYDKIFAKAEDNVDV